MGALKFPTPQHMPDMSQQNVGKKAPEKKKKERKDAPHLTLITHDSSSEDLRENEAAGFWIRFLAAMVDGIAVGLVTQGGVMILAVLMGSAAKTNPLMMTALGFLAGMAISVAYYVYPTSKWGATLGKKVFKLRVINSATGERISVSKAFTREIVGKTLSYLLLMIGYVMAAFTDEKKALHDMVAGTRVVKVKD